MTATSEKLLRIGEVAELTGTTPRTIRYYEEIGLLPGPDDRAQGKHRFYTRGGRRADHARSSGCATCSGCRSSSSRSCSRRRPPAPRSGASTARPRTRRRSARILNESLGHIATQLELVRGRRRELEQLEQELVDKRRTVNGKLAALEP